jgi:hypothetical protein
MQRMTTCCLLCQGRTTVVLTSFKRPTPLPRHDNTYGSLLPSSLVQRVLCMHQLAEWWGAKCGRALALLMGNLHDPDHYRADNEPTSQTIYVIELTLASGWP